MYEIDADCACATAVGALEAHRLYRGVRANATHFDCLRVDCSTLPEVLICVVTPPCGQFDNLLGDNDILMGVDDDAATDTDFLRCSEETDTAAIPEPMNPPHPKEKEVSTEVSPGRF